MLAQEILVTISNLNIVCLVRLMLKIVIKKSGSTVTLEYHLMVQVDGIF